MRRAWGMAVLMVLGTACSDTVRLSRSHPGADAGPVADAGPGDAGAQDAGPEDGGPDGGPTDGGTPVDGGTPDGGWSGTWEPLGPPLGHEAQVAPAMALDPSGAPLVAYAELVESPGMVATELHVVRWSGSAWEPLGGTIASSTQRLPYSAPLWVRLVTDGTGRPVLAFGDSGPGATVGAFPLQTWAFDGTSWQTVPVPLTAPQLSGFALGRGADGRVRLALSTGQQLEILILGAGGWAAAVPAFVHDGGVSEPDLDLAPDGTPLVAFSEAASPGSFGTLRTVHWTDAGWTDLGVPSPEADGLLFHSPRVRARSDGGVVVAASELQYDMLSKTQIGVDVPVFSFGDGGWALLDPDGAPGGSGLSEPIPGSPVGLQLAADVPVVVSTGADGGVSLRAFGPSGAPAVAPVLGGFGAGTLVLMPDGTAVVGAVMPVSHEPGWPDGGQVQLLHFTGTPASAGLTGPAR